ncbi:MAG: NTP pyrophosphatase (non-canonical NTP hydrolase) [Candidatus Endobugula sp.]|jgi:NTP pyrophosphatase (non-canonical NTP hydrolase)
MIKKHIMSELDHIKKTLAQFSKDRDWEQFHSPKNLAMALSVEVAEIVEHFQWLSEEEANTLTAAKRHAIAEEIADTQMYLLLLAEKLDVDIIRSVNEKIVKNAEKYPIEKCKGSSKKAI